MLLPIGVARKLASQRRHERLSTPCSAYTCQYVVRVLTFANFTGSIFETEKRKRVVPLLYAQTAVFVAEVTFLSKSPFPANHEHALCYTERPRSC